MTNAERQYDLWARVYDVVWRRYANRTINALLDRMELGTGTRILNVGCGTGILEQKLLRADGPHTIVGVDASSNMVKRAQAKVGNHPAVTIRRATASDLPFGDDSFDVVVTVSVLHYLKDPVACLREIRRVLRPTGRVFVVDWSCDYTIMRLRDAVLRALDPAHVRTYTSREVRDLFQEAGLAIQRLDTFRSGTYGLFFAAAHAE